MNSSKTWTSITDDNLNDRRAEALTALVGAAEEYNAGTITSSGADDAGRTLILFSVAEIDGRYVGVVVDLQGEDVDVIWAVQS